MPSRARVPPGPIRAGSARGSAPGSGSRALPLPLHVVSVGEVGALREGVLEGLKGPSISYVRSLVKANEWLGGK